MKKVIQWEMKNPAWTGFMLTIGVAAAVAMGDRFHAWTATPPPESPTVVYFAPDLAWPHWRKWPGGGV